MLHALLIPLLLLPGPPTPAVDAPAVLPLLPTRVRPTGDIARTILREAAQKSPTIRQLVAQLDATDVFVYVELQFDLRQTQGRTTLLVSNEAGRFLRIAIDAMLDPRRRQEILGHELQHALEIARDRTVRDGDGVTRLFSRIGWRTGASSFETAEALDTEQRVHRELAGIVTTRPAGGA